MIEVVAALIWDGDRFLLCRRPENKSRANLWELAGGKVEQGETREQALVRECREELAITVEPLETACEVTYEYPDLTVHLTVIKAKITAGTPKALEHSELRWTTIGQSLDMELCPADREVLLKLLRDAQRRPQD